MLKLLKDLDPKDKKIIVRLDLDVPIENKKVADGSRIDAAFTTLKYLLVAKKLYLIGHADSPGGKVVESLRLKPQAQYIAQKLGLEFNERDCKIFNHRYLLGDKIEILENLRFNKGEENNDPKFAQKIARLGEAFVFEAFATSHRKHASVYGLVQFLPTYLGLRCQKEMQVLDDLRKQEKETVVLVGGAKAADKAVIIKNYKAKKVLFGGKTASEIWQNKNDYKEERFILPIDGVLENGEIKNYADLDEKELAMVRDIGSKTIGSYTQILKNIGKNIIFSGPLGQYEKKEFASGTKLLFEEALKTKKKTIILGGDSAMAARLFGLTDQFSYISVGGGASLEYLAKGAMVIK